MTSETTTSAGSPASAPTMGGKRAAFVLGSAMLIMGACGLVYEYVLGVLGDHLMGTSHEQAFVTIGLMMFAMGLAALWQPRMRRSLVDHFLLVQILLGCLGGLGPLVVHTAFVHMASWSVVHYSVALGVGFLIGLEIPLLIRINRRYVKELPRNVGQILAMDYVGSLAGALIFAYLLLGEWPLERIALGLGALNVGIGAFVLFWFRGVVRHKGLLAGGILCAWGLLAAGMAFGGSWMVSLEQRCFADPVIHAETSKYQRIVLTERQDDLRLYLNGHLQFSSRDEAIYHEALVHPAMRMAPRHGRVLVLGGGDGLAVREVLRWPDVREVVLVDLDPAVVRLAREHPRLVERNGGALSDARVQLQEAVGVSAGEPREVLQPSRLADSFQASDQELTKTADVHAIVMDADRFVRSTGRDFDVAILDFPDPSSIEIAKLYGLGFYRALGACLAPDAVVSIQSSSPWLTRKAYLCIGKTLRAAGYATLPHHQHIPSFGEWGFWLAWREGLTPKARLESFRNSGPLPIATAWATTETLTAGFAFGKGWLDEPSDLEVNTRNRPVLHTIYRREAR